MKRYCEVSLTLLFILSTVLLLLTLVILSIAHAETTVVGDSGWYSNGNTTVTSPNNLKVGIGTTPSGQLGVKSAQSSNWSFGFTNEAYPRAGALYYESDGTGYGFSIGYKNPNTGIFSDYIYIKDGGYVGIGGIPSHPLDVKQSDATSGIRVSGGINPSIITVSGLNTIKLQAIDNGPGYVGTETPTEFDIIANNTPVIHVSPIGRVGIGTSPSNLEDMLVVSGPIRIADNGTKPTCAAAYRGMIWHDFGGTGVKDTVEICAKDAADAYAWRVLY